MLRRFVVIVVLLGCVGAVVIPRADAHYIYVSGRLVYHSLGCEWALKGVPNTLSKPAVTECRSVITLVDTLCENPQNRSVVPGQAATQTVLVGQEPFTEGNLTGKGKATVSVSIADDAVLAALQDVPGVCVNPNWHLVAALVREVTVDLSVYECTNEACSTNTGVLASTATLDCSLPEGFSILLPPPDGTEYECTTISSVHVK